MARSEKVVFTREATGLIREISPRNALITTLSVTSWAVGAATGFVFMPFLWPGADMSFAYLILLPILLLHSATWALIGWAIPRSGGDYVWTARILHPALGSATNFVVVLYNSIFLGSFAGWGVSYLLTSTVVSAGIITNNPGLTNWAMTFFTSPLAILGLGGLTLLYCTAILIFGITPYLKQQFVLWLIGTLGTLAVIGLLLGTSPAQFSSAFDRSMGQYMTYQSVIDSAKSSGFSWAPSIMATFSAVSFAWYTHCGYQFSAYFSGELRKVRASMLASTMGNNVITTIVYALFAWVFVRAVGNNWLQSLSYLAYAQPTLYKLPVFPNPFFLASVLTNNLALALAINISLFIANVVLITSNWVGMTRIVFGMSFDRILPTKLADVSDRFHSPAISVLFLTFLGFVGLVGVVYYGPMFGMVNMNLAYAIAYTVGCLAAAAFPFAKKNLYQRSVIARYNVGGFPIITIVGTAAAAGFVWIAYSAGLNPSISPVSNYAFASLALAFIGSGALYYIFRAYHKAKEGIDIGRNFMEIPPE